MNLKVLLTILLISISVNSYSLKIGLGAGFDGYSSGISVPMDLNNIRIEPKIEIFFDDNSMDAEYFDNKIGRYKERSSSKIDVSLGLGLYYLIGSEKTIYPYIGIQYLYSIYELLSETLYEDERHIKREDIYLYKYLCSC